MAKHDRLSCGRWFNERSLHSKGAHKILQIRPIKTLDSSGNEDELKVDSHHASDMLILPDPFVASHVGRSFHSSSVGQSWLTVLQNRGAYVSRASLERLFRAAAFSGLRLGSQHPLLSIFGPYFAPPRSRWAWELQTHGVGHYSAIRAVPGAKVASPDDPHVLEAVRSWMSSPDPQAVQRKAFHTSARLDVNARQGMDIFLVSSPRIVV